MSESSSGRRPIFLPIPLGIVALLVATAALVARASQEVVAESKLVYSAAFAGVCVLGLAWLNRNQFRAVSTRWRVLGHLGLLTAILIPALYIAGYLLNLVWP